MRISILSLYLYQEKDDKTPTMMTTNNNIDFRKTCKVGQYHYAPHRNYYGVWVYDYVSEKSASASFVCDFRTKEEARLFTWEMNGWGTPKTPLA